VHSLLRCGVKTVMPWTTDRRLTVLRMGGRPPVQATVRARCIVCVCVCVCAMRHQSISGACPPCPVSAYVHCPPLSPSIQRCPRRPSHHAVHPDSTVRPSVRRAYVFVSREERDRRLTRRLIVASVVDVVLVFVRFIWSLFDQRCFLQSSERVRVFFHNHKRNNEK